MKHIGRKLRAVAVAAGLCAAVVTIGVQEANAAPVLCPDPQGSYTRQYGVETDPNTAVCYAFGGGNLNGAGNDAFLALDPDWDFVGQNDAFAAGTVFTGTSGAFFIDDYDPTLTYALGIKDGGKPKWAVFLLPAGVSSGTWYITSAGGSLSHLALYSTEREVTPGEEPLVPEPATLALLGLGLLAGGARIRQRFNRA